MSVLHCNLARPDFRKYNFEEAAPAVQGPIVSLPVLFQAFHAQGEANQQLIELDQGRVGTSLRQIDAARDRTLLFLFNFQKRRLLGAFIATGPAGFPLEASARQRVGQGRLGGATAHSPGLLWPDAPGLITLRAPGRATLLGRAALPFGAPGERCGAAVRPHREAGPTPPIARPSNNPGLGARRRPDAVSVADPRGLARRTAARAARERLQARGQVHGGEPLRAQPLLGAGRRARTALPSRCQRVGVRLGCWRRAGC